MSNENIWQGTMLEALMKTKDHKHLRAVEVNRGPYCGSSRAYMEQLPIGYFWGYDNSPIKESHIGLRTAMTPARLYHLCTNHEEREMSILDAVTYAQKNNLDYLETTSGTLYRIGPTGYIEIFSKKNKWINAPWLFLDKHTWIIPLNPKWVPLTVVEFKTLKIQNV